MTTAIEFMVNQLLTRQPPEDRKSRVVRLSQTMSKYQVAFELGVSRTTVYNILKAHRESRRGKPDHAATHH